MINIPKYFRIEELVPKVLFERYRESEYRLWWSLDYRMLWTNDALRKRYGKMVCNTWFWGGTHHERGLRVFGTSTGASMSQHLFGRACDLVPINVTVDEMRNDVKRHPELEEFQHIRCIEINVPWFHYDVRNWNGSVLEVTP